MQDLNLVYTEFYSNGHTGENSEHVLNWQKELHSKGFTFTVLQDKAELLSETVLQKYEVILLDIYCIEEQLLEVLDRVQTLSAVPVLIAIANPINFNGQIATLENYFDDIITPDTSADILYYRLSKILNQRGNKANISGQTRMLHAISVLAQDMHHSEHLTTLILDTITSINSNLGVYGVMITVIDDEQYHFYAGTHNPDSGQQIYESLTYTHHYDPLIYVINSNASLICNDVKKHPYYTPVPIIQNAQSAIIIPLKPENKAIGSLAIFSDKGKFESEDLVLYEILATHFARAYHNLRHYEDQRKYVHSTKQSLYAWQLLTSTYEILDVANTLYALLQDVHGIEDAVVWLFEPHEDVQSLVVSSRMDSIQDLLDEMLGMSELDALMSELDVTMQPVTFYKSHSKHLAFHKLFLLLECDKIVFIPIADKTLMGGIFATTTYDIMPDSTLNMVQSLAYATAHSMERNLLITSLREQHSRLDAVLCSISEALFFVNNKRIVIYCNPQFTELTSILPSQVIGKPQEVLLHLLVANTTNADEVLGQFRQAIEQVSTPDYSIEEYPIIGFHHTASDTDLYIEFMRTANEQALDGWLGFIGNDERSSLVSDDSPIEFMEVLLEDLTVMFMHLQREIMILPAEYSMLSSRGYIQQLHALEDQAQKILTVWNNFLQFRKGSTSVLELSAEPWDMVEFIQNVIDTHLIEKQRRPIHIDSRPPHTPIHIDESLMTLLVINILGFLSHYSNNPAPIFVNVICEKQYVLISFQEKTSLIPQEVMDHLYEADTDSDNNQERAIRAGIILSQQILKAHGGMMSIKNSRGWGLMLNIQIPIVRTNVILADEANQPMPLNKVTEQEFSIMAVESSQKLLERFYDELADEGCNILVERSVHDMLINLSLVSVDVIFLEASNSGKDLIDICRSIRQETHIPLLIIAKSELEKKCVQALSEGADGYLLLPLENDVLIAHINSLKQRKDMTTRMAAPIQIGDLFIEFTRRRVYLNNELLDLTAKEYKLLLLLASHPNQVLSHQQLLSRIWGPEYRDDKQYLWVNISRLRRKLEPTKDSPRYIHTEQGIGYCFREP